jgi:Uma2 family endonuclease
MTSAEFMAWETAQPERWEFIAGHVYALVGASDSHVTIVQNLTAALQPALRGGPCRLFTTDMKLAAETATHERIAYPDAFVTCDERDRSDRYVKRFPVIIIEVLSASTESNDRGAKFEDYRSIVTLSEVIFIDSRRQHVEVHRRTDHGTWELVYDTGAGAIVLTSLGGIELAVDDLYADVSFEQPQPRLQRMN